MKTLKLTKIDELANQIFEQKLRISEIQENIMNRLEYTIILLADATKK